MRIVIVGAGVVGFHLAEQLSREGHDISVVDSDPELIRTIDERYDVLAVSGDASLPSVLERAGARGAELVIAVTDRDTTNLVVSLIARKLGARKVIVRVRDAEFSQENAVLSPDDLGADVVINPTETTVRLLERLVRNPGATDVADFAGGELQLWGFEVSAGSRLAGVQLKQLRGLAEEIHALIVAIERADGKLVIPRGEDSIDKGDHVYVFIQRKSVRAFRKLVNPAEGQIGRVVVSGATQLGIEVARRLEGRVRKVILVDRRREAAEFAAETLGKTLVLCGDVGDPSFAREYDFDNVECFLALDNDDQANLMNALLARKESESVRLAVLLQQPQYLPILRSLDLGAVVTPRLLTVSAILSHIRRGHVLQVSRIGESGAEAVEYVVGEDSALVGCAIKDLHLPKEMIIGAIFRSDTYQIPRGDTVIAAEDHVVVLALPDAMNEVQKFFSKRRLFKRR